MALGCRLSWGRRFSAAPYRDLAALTSLVSEGARLGGLGFMMLFRTRIDSKAALEILFDFFFKEGFLLFLLARAPSVEGIY